MESIMTSKRVCYLCGAAGQLEKHHAIHGTANRRLADREGLWVWLCPEHHRRLHDKGDNDRVIQVYAQRIWMSVNSKTTDDFRKVFGKSYM